MSEPTNSGANAISNLVAFQLEDEVAPPSPPLYPPLSYAGIEDESHSARLSQEARACREMFRRAYEEGDSSKATSLARVLASLEANLEKARLREGEYLSKREIAEIETRFTARVTDIMRKYLPEDVWGKVVDELILARTFT